MSFDFVRPTMPSCFSVGSAEVLLNYHVAAGREGRVLAAYQGGVDRTLVLWVLCPINETDQVPAVEVTEPVDFVHGRDGGSEPGDDLGGQIEAEVHPLRPDVEEDIALRRDGVAVSRAYFTEPVKLGRPWPPEERVPSLRTEGRYA